MRIVWHCTDPVGADMAGPGIRAVELSHRLAERHEVVLVAPGAAGLRADSVRGAEPADLSVALAGADAFVTMGFGFPIHQALRFRGRLVLDLYDPVLLEQLAQFGPSPTPAQRVSLAHVRARLLALLARADHVLCASPQQRAFWLGWLGAAGRLAPATLAADPEARRLLAIVPFGLPEEPPRGDGSALRRELGIPGGAPVALFWGGLWDWMDPALAVRAVAQLGARGSAVHLVFLGGARPGGDTMRASAEEAHRAVSELGLGKQVHFLQRWIPYRDRGSILLGADIAVTAHRPSLESELAFRTRLLDCLWACLPVACTRGDTLAGEAEREGWGSAADPGDAPGLAAAMATLLDAAGRARATAAMSAALARYQWSRSSANILQLLEASPPARPSLLVPGEVAGGDPLAILQAFGAKALKTLLRRERSSLDDEE